MHTYRPPSDSCGPEQTATMNSSTRWTTTDTTAHFTEHLSLFCLILEKLERRVVRLTVYYILTQVFSITVSLAFLLKVFPRKNRKRIISSIHSALCYTLPGTSYNNPTQHKLEMCANDSASTFSKSLSRILSNCQKSVPALLHRKKYISLWSRKCLLLKSLVYTATPQETHSPHAHYDGQKVSINLKNVSCEQFEKSVMQPTNMSIMSHAVT